MADSPTGGDSKQSMRTVFALVLILGLAVATIVASVTVLQFPTPVTDEADDINWLYNITLSLAMLVFVGVEALIIWVCLRYARRAGADEPAQVHGNNKLEFGWTAIPIVILVVLFALAAPQVVDLRSAVSADERDLEVTVIGRQWFWEYDYPEQGIHIQEIPDYEDPDPPALVVPEGAKVQLNIESGDVIHSFYVPKFLYKIMAIPGQVNRMHFTANELGRFSGQCAQFCGLSHAQMLLVVEVVTQEEFDAWVAEQQAAEPEPTPTSEPDGDGDGGDGAPAPLAITSTDNEFNTDEMRAPADQDVTVELSNQGVAAHNWALTGEEVATGLITGGEMAAVTFNLPAGEYEFLCDVHPTEMQGTLIVE
ncbi:MAG: cytochrome c oxidase subunit II [Dehalococcoidia bacterium]|nr:cytochrome c oxidase subunit II [Dehalococcoidia bacterium]